MKCCWSTPCANVIAEIWYPREGSGVEETKAFCSSHAIDGMDRSAACARVGYNIEAHRSVIRDYWVIETISLRPPPLPAS